MQAHQRRLQNQGDWLSHLATGLSAWKPVNRRRNRNVLIFYSYRRRVAGPEGRAHAHNKKWAETKDGGGSGEAPWGTGSGTCGAATYKKPANIG